MESHDIQLTDHESALVASLIEAGIYASVTEALHDGLRRVEQAHTARPSPRADLQTQIAYGLAEIERGAYLDVTDAELDATIASLGRIAAQRNNPAYGA